MHKQTRDSIHALVEQYNTRFAEKGIHCTVYQKYAEQPASTRLGLSAVLDEQREKRYHNQPNRHYFVILRFSPVDKTRVKKTDCKEYGFAFRSIQRIHTGEVPVETVCSETKMLHKIEKRLQRMLKRAEASPAEQVCQDRWYDVFRYTLLLPYRHKGRFLG